MNGDIIVSGAVLIGIIAYFLRDFFLSIKELKKMTDSHEVKINVIQNNEQHANDKFDKLYDAVRELTKELKILNITFNKKKD